MPDSETSDSRRVTDPGQLQQIVEKIFARVPVSLAEKRGEVPVGVAGYRDGFLEVKHTEPPAPVRVLTVVQSGHRMLLECAVVVRGDRMERLKPVRLHLHRQIRKAPRVEVPEGPKTLWITNCVPVPMVLESLSASNSKRDAVLNTFGAELSKRYPQSSIQLRKSNRTDSRMRVMMEYKRPVFYTSDQAHLSRLREHFAPPEEVENARRGEATAKTHPSEICEPLWYRNLIFYGYVQVMSSDDLQDSDYDAVKSIARGLHSGMLSAALPNVNVSCPVVDIHETGVGFIHPHVPLVMRSFMPGSEVIFDLNFPSGPSFPCLGSIRNIRSRETNHRMGVEMYPIEPANLEILHRYLAEVKSDPPPPSDDPE